MNDFVFDDHGSAYKVAHLKVEKAVIHKLHRFFKSPCFIVKVHSSNERDLQLYYETLPAAQLAVVEIISKCEGGIDCEDTIFYTGSMMRDSINMGLFDYVQKMKYLGEIKEDLSERRRFDRGF